MELWIDCFDQGAIYIAKVLPNGGIKNIYHTMSLYMLKEIPSTFHAQYEFNIFYRFMQALHLKVI